MGKLISSTNLTVDERKNIANQIRCEITSRKLDDITEMRKLKIMLDLFEKFGREFNKEMPVPCLDWRALRVRLFNNKNQPCEVVLRQTSIQT